MTEIKKTVGLLAPVQQKNEAMFWFLVGLRPHRSYDDSFDAYHLRGGWR